MVGWEAGGVGSVTIGYGNTLYRVDVEFGFLCRAIFV